MHGYVVELDWSWSVGELYWWSQSEAERKMVGAGERCLLFVFNELSDQ